MTVTPQEVDYNLPTNVDTTSPLVNPSHSELHNEVNRATSDLNNRVSQLELVLAGLTAPQGSIEQARLVANSWTVAGNLVADNKLLIPILWNVTERAVSFQAAKATVITPADADIELNIVVGAVLNGPTYDSSTQTSILKTGKLVITAGQRNSSTLGIPDFKGDHPVNTYVAAYVAKVGSGAAPGADLTIQLNRNL
jgi:hypothetical protein